MQKLPIDGKLEAPRTNRKPVLISNKIIPKYTEHESIVDTRVKDGDSRGTLRRANLAQVARNQSRLTSKSTNDLDIIDSYRSKSPVMNYSPKASHSILLDQSVRKPVIFSNSKPTRTPSRENKNQIYDIYDDNTELDELKFKDEPDGNLQKKLY